MTRLAEPERERETDGDSGAIADREAIADRLRDRGERIRDRELETALDRLQASGEVTPAERQALGALSARIADTIVERWASRLAESEVDPETALTLFFD